MSSEQDFEERVRTALHREAGTVEPAGDGLRRIQARTGRASAVRGRRRLAVGGAVLATAAAVTTFAVVGSQLGQGGKGAGDVAPAGPAADAQSVQVFYLDATPERRGEPGSETVDDPGLYRETREVIVEDDPVEAAVRELFRSEPSDPDYENPWRDIALRDVRTRGDVVEVSVDGVPQGRARGAAEQQLAHTAQAAAEGPVTIELTVNEAAPWRIPPAPEVGTYAGIWVQAPTQGATVASPVTFSGMAATFEGNVAYEILRGGEVVARGATITEGGMGVWSAWSFTERLQPGAYTVVAFDEDPALGGRRDVDTKDFTVE